MKIKLCLWCVVLSFLCCSLVSAEEWKEYKRSHFIIYYKNSPLGFVKEIEETAEEYYHEITRDLGYTRYKGWTWDERAKIYIYDNAEDYVKSGKRARWSHGVASTRSKVIRTFPTAHGFFDSTLPHELGHIIFREFVGYKSQIPSWFEEGVVMYQEKAKRWGSHDTVRKAIEENKFIPLKKLSTMILRRQTEKEKVNLFYAEAASVVNYLIAEMGENRFVRFCRKLESGMTFEVALSSIYVRFRDVDRLNKSWMDFLENE